MTYDFEPLSCPMCGGELMYSEGTHDLCCVRNTPELLNTETGRGRTGETTGDGGERSAAMPGDKDGDGGERISAMPGNELEQRGGTLHEQKVRYGSAHEEVNAELSIHQLGERASESPESVEEAHVGVNEYRMSKRDVEKSTECVFALSFTESGKHGTLWSIRTVHGRTNYFSLMRLMGKIEKRQSRGEPLAANVPNLPRKVERSKECKLAFRYSLEIEDLYSIKYSSETVDKLAMYYGLTEPDIRHIQAAEIGGE